MTEEKPLILLPQCLHSPSCQVAAKQNSNKKTNEKIPLSPFLTRLPQNTEGTCKTVRFSCLSTQGKLGSSFCKWLKERFWLVCPENEEEHASKESVKCFRCLSVKLLTPVE